MVVEKQKESVEERWKRLANAIANNCNADVFLFSGEIDDPAADRLIEEAKSSAVKENAYLILTTRGGSPDAAYRMTRYLKRQYKKLVLYIHGTCKSAGTLVAVGADEIVLSDFGEFGPLDIQLGKRDELFEMVSGLNITQALNSLNTRAQDIFRSTLIDLKSGSRGQLSTKLAADIATDLAIGLYGSIYAQIDPAQLGSIERSINIASDYCKRLKTENVKTGTIDKLVSGYPSHNFVIDLEEAKNLFNNVRTPNSNEEELAKCFSRITRNPAENKQALVWKINIAEATGDDDGSSNTNTSANKGGNREESGGGTDNTTSSQKTPRTSKRPRKGKRLRRIAKKIVL